MASVLRLNWTDFEDSLINIQESISYNNGDALQEGHRVTALSSKAAKMMSVDVFLLGCTGVFLRRCSSTQRQLKEAADGTEGAMMEGLCVVDGKVGSVLAQMAFPADEHRRHPSFVVSAAALLARIAYGNIIALGRTGGNDGGRETATGHATQAGMIIEEGVKNFCCELASGLVAAGVFEAVESLELADSDTLPPNFSHAQAVCNRVEEAVSASRETVTTNEHTAGLSLVVEALSEDPHKEGISVLKLCRVLRVWGKDGGTALVGVEDFMRLGQTEDEAEAALDLAAELARQGALGVLSEVSGVVTTEVAKALCSKIRTTPRMGVLLIRTVTALAAQTDDAMAIVQHFRDLVSPVVSFANSIASCNGRNEAKDDNNIEKEEEERVKMEGFVERALGLCVRAVECRAEDIVARFVESGKVLWEEIGEKVQLGRRCTWGTLERLVELYTDACLHRVDVSCMVSAAVQFLTGGLRGTLAADKEALQTAAESLVSLAGLIVRRRMDVGGYPHFLEMVGETFGAVFKWGGAAGNGALIGRFVSKAVEAGVEQSLRGESIYKAIVFNWTSVIKEVSGLAERGSVWRIELLDGLTRVGRRVLTETSSTELFMRYAVPLAIRVNRADATAREIEETLTGIVSNVDRGLRTARVMQVYHSYEALQRIAEATSAEAQESVRELFWGLVSRGRREDIKLATDATASPAELEKARYRALLEGVMGTQAGLPVPSKLRMSLFRVLSAATAICAPSPGASANTEDARDKAWCVRAVEHVLGPLTSLINGSAGAVSVTKEDISETLMGLHKITLFQSLFSSEAAEIAGGGKKEAEEEKDTCEEKRKEDGCDEGGGSDKRPEASGTEIMERINRRFPKAVVEDARMMEDLMGLGARTAHVRRVRPQYMPVVESLSRALRVLMEGRDADTGLGERVRRVHKFLVEQQPGNAETVARLCTYGYSPSLWEYDGDQALSLCVEVDLRRNIEYGHKSSLEAVYGEYVDILTRVGVESVVVADQSAPVATRLLFNGTQYLTLEAVRARKAAALCAIESKLGFSCTEGSPEAVSSSSSSSSAPDEEREEERCYYASRVRTLVRREELIDEQYRKERVRAEKARGEAAKKRFRATLHRSLFDCARCCGSQIAGCFAPDGTHAEKPIEDGLKAQWGIISLYEEGEKEEDAGTEIENAEVLFADQGGYVFKSYTNGHAYDTSMVWVVFFHALLQSGALPALIVPNNYPSRSTYAALAQHVAPQLVAAELTFKDAGMDGKAEQYTPYYDTPTGFKPDLVRAGDIVLTRDNTEALLEKMNFVDKSKMQTFARSSTELYSDTQPQHSTATRAKRLRRDLPGSITTEVLESLGRDYPGHTGLVNAIGRPLAGFVVNHVQCAPSCCDTLDIRKVIWSDKGRRRAGKKRKRHRTRTAASSTQTGQAATPETLDEGTRERIFEEAVGRVHERFDVLYSRPPSAVICEGVQRFFEVLGHLRTLSEAGGKQARCPQQPGSSAASKLLSSYKDTIRGRIRFQRIGDLDREVRHELMAWVFHNEQKEWSGRGGRDRQETLKDFLALGGEERQFPGVAATCDAFGNGQHTPQESNSTAVLGYCIGEFVDDETYEVTHAWVDPRARGLRIASTLYLHVLDGLEHSGKAPGAKACKRLACDVVLGSTQRMGFSEMFCRFTMVERKRSWATGTDTGKTEQFERLVFSFTRVKTCYRMFVAAKKLGASKAAQAVVLYRKPLAFGVCAIGVGFVLTMAFRCLRKVWRK